jgi:HEAT repeat protein
MPLLLLLLLVLAQSVGDSLVQQLRPLPTPLPATGRSDGSIDPIELQRREVYGQIRKLGNDALPALARGLNDPDVRLRKNVALALGALAGTWWDASVPAMDIRPLLGELIGALKDEDASVRAWSAQAIGAIGSDAAPAVPALIALLANSDEGSRNSAGIALHGIGPAARDALPALRKALEDPSVNVRRFAKRAIERIEARPQ